MADPKHFCGKCGNRMVYDALLSKKGKRSVWWCLGKENKRIKSDHDPIIESYEEFNVNDNVKSIRRYIFKNETPKS